MIWNTIQIENTCPFLVHISGRHVMFNTNLHLSCCNTNGIWKQQAACFIQLSYVCPANHQLCFTAQDVSIETQVVHWQVEPTLTRHTPLPVTGIKYCSEFDIQRTVLCDIFLYWKPTRCTISQIYLIKYCACFGQVHCPSSGVSQHCLQAIGICHASSVGCLLADSQIPISVYTVLRYSWWWTVDLSETCRVLYQINLRNSASVGFQYKNTAVNCTPERMCMSEEMNGFISYTEKKMQIMVCTKPHAADLSTDTYLQE